MLNNERNIHLFIEQLSPLHKVKHLSRLGTFVPKPVPVPCDLAAYQHSQDTARFENEVRLSFA